jgi:hypothetical protein
MSTQIKSIKNKEFEYQPKSIGRDEIIGLAVLACIALAVFLLLFRSGKEFDYWDFILPLAGATALYPLKMHHDKMARDNNYIDYLAKQPINEVTDSIKYLDPVSKALVKRFLETLAGASNSNNPTL